MPVRQVGTQATWKTKRDPVTLPPMGPIVGGGFYPRNPKIAILFMLGHFHFFFQYLSLLIP